MKFKLLLSMFFMALPLASHVHANNWYWERYWNGCCYSYRQTYYPQQTYQAPKTTVINNLIGIPVPVQYTQPIAAQGTTVYGYSSVADAYAPVDMGLLYNQAARLTDQAQQLAGQASTDFASLVEAEGSHRAEVAKIIAQGQTAREALLAAKGAPSQVTQRAFTFKVVQSGSDVKIEQVQTATGGGSGNGFDLATLKAGDGNISDILTNRCVRCHGNEKAAGNLNFQTTITDAQQAEVLERLVTDDQSKRMPRTADGSAGRLSAAEIKAFFKAMSK